MTDVHVPSKATLKRYGLSIEEWQVISDRQGGTCGVCGTVPPSGTLHIDHEHVRGWRSMKPTARREYVRGLLCWFCNSVLLRRGASPERLRSAANYLDVYLNK